MLYNVGFLQHVSIESHENLPLKAEKQKQNANK